MLQVYIARLRRKLEHEPVHPRRLVSGPGAEYRLSTLPVPVA